jgi:ATP-binding cassette subfamily F protein 3
VAAPITAPKPATRINPHKLAKAEARVADLEQRIAAIEAELESPELYADGGTRAATLGKQGGELRASLETAELELLALYEASAA